MAASDQNKKSDKSAKSTENSQSDPKEENKNMNKQSKDKSQTITRAATRSGSVTPAENKSDKKQKADKRKLEQQHQQVMKNVNAILGLDHDLQSLPKIPKLQGKPKPAQAAGSASQVATDQENTPVTYYPYKPASAPVQNTTGNQIRMQNPATIDVVPQYLQDITNTHPGSHNQPTLQQHMMSNAPVSQFQSPPQMAMAVPQMGAPQMVSPQMYMPQYQYHGPQIMGTPQVIDRSSNLMYIPTPMYQNQGLIMNPNNIVTIPLGGNDPAGQGFPQPDFADDNVPVDQPAVEQVNPPDPQPQDQYLEDIEFDVDPEQDIAELLGEEEDDIQMPQPVQANQGHQQQQAQIMAPVQNVQQNEAVLPDPDDFMDEEANSDDEEVGPPTSNEKLATTVDHIWDQALKNPDGMKIKETYGGIFRPSNINNITKTLVNPLVKDSTPKQAFKNDALPRSVQTAIIKGSLAMVETLQTTSDLAIDPEAEIPDIQKAIAAQRRQILKKGLRSIKCLAYSTTKLNQLRRQLQKPYLAKKYQRLCTRQLDPSHQWLYGNDLANEIRQQDEAYKLSRGLGANRRARGYWPRGNFTPRGQPRWRGQSFQQVQQPFYQPRFQGKSYYSFQNFPQLTSVNHAIIIDDYNIPHKSNLTQNLSVKQCLVDLNVPRAAHTNIPCYHSINFSSSGQRWQTTGIQRTSCQQRAWPRQQGQLNPPQTTPDRSISPVSLDYAHSLGIEFKSFEQGGLENHLENWKKLTSDPIILDLVQGIKLDFKEPPVQNKIPHEIKFSQEETELVKQELDRFMNLGIIEESEILPGDFVSNLFIRRKKDPGKVRILVNLKPLNKFVKHIHFKMDTLESVLQMIRPGCFMVSLDLESSFYALNVHPDHRKYLKVICMGKIFVFKKLPMGYSQSPMLFTKLMKIPLAYLRTEFGYTNSAFVDDLFLLEDTFDFAQQNAIDTAETVQSLGYTVNVPKSGIKPQQKKNHLGMIINSIQMTVTLTQEKIEKLLEHAHDILSKKKVQIRAVASLIGQMNAARFAVKFGPLHTKSLEIAKNMALAQNEGDFEGFMELSVLDRMDIDWWIKTCPIAYKSLLPPPIDFTIYTDASLLGFGYCLLGTARKGGGRWSPQEATLHINVLEIKAIKLAILSLFPAHKNLNLKIFSDSMVAIQCINKQGSTQSLPCNTATRSLLLYCEENNIHVSVAHVPGVQNQIADKKSRIFRNPDTEWQISQTLFLKICTILGFTPQIDMFAERLNAKCKIYCSWDLDPFAQHIDAFTVDWNMYEYIYAFPCFSLIGRVMHKFMQTSHSKTRLLLLFPV